MLNDVNSDVNLTYVFGLVWFTSPVLSFSVHIRSHRIKFQNCYYLSVPHNFVVFWRVSLLLHSQKFLLGHRASDPQFGIDSSASAICCQASLTMSSCPSFALPQAFQGFQPSFNRLISFPFLFINMTKLFNHFQFENP